MTRIHIDQHPYESPNPTTGAALYRLANVVDGLELYREVSGDREDAPIENGPATVQLTEDEHIHSGHPKVFSIIVNAQKKEVLTPTLSFDQVVALAFNPVPTGPYIMFSITYEDGPRANPDGTLTKGETVRIKDGMKFRVTETDKS